MNLKPCRATGITRKRALDSKQYWVNRASTAARNEKEKGIALQYENEDSFNERSEGLLTVLGVEPQALVEMVRWVITCYPKRACSPLLSCRLWITFAYSSYGDSGNPSCMQPRARHSAHVGHRACSATNGLEGSRAASQHSGTREKAASDSERQGRQ